MSLSVIPRFLTHCSALIYLVLASTMVAAAPVGPVKHTKGLLWRISAPGLVPSYLFGTMHSSDPRVTALPKPLTDSFDRSTSFSMELIFTGAGIVHMAEIMFYDQSNNLKDVIGEELYEETRSVLKKRVSLHAISTRKNRGRLLWPWAHPGKIKASCFWI